MTPTRPIMNIQGPRTFMFCMPPRFFVHGGVLEWPGEVQVFAKKMFPPPPAPYRCPPETEPISGGRIRVQGVEGNAFFANTGMAGFKIRIDG